jgi:hypothetical protein
VVEQHKQANQVLDQEILQDQEVQEHQTILITHAQHTQVVVEVVDLITTLDQESVVMLELVVEELVEEYQVEEVQLTLELQTQVVVAVELEDLVHQVKQVQQVDQVLLL